MTLIHPELEVILRLGTLERRVPVAAIAAVTGLPSLTLRESLSRLLFALSDRDAEGAHPVPGEPTEGDRSDRSFVPPPENIAIPLVRSFEKARAPAREALPAPLTAESLADMLNDRASVAFYRTLVATTTPSLVREALDRTLTHRARPCDRPGAYFTTVLRGLLRARENAPRYARTPPTPA